MKIHYTIIQTHVSHQSDISEKEKKSQAGLHHTESQSGDA
jgi:hypothetical protein